MDFMEQSILTKKYPNDPNDSLYKERQRIKSPCWRSGAGFCEITLAGSHKK
jgi:hypothetical protein